MAYMECLGLVTSTVFLCEFAEIGSPKDEGKEWQT